jgi:hypothetical protein
MILSESIRRGFLRRLEILRAPQTLRAGRATVVRSLHGRLRSQLGQPRVIHGRHSDRRHGAPVRARPKMGGMNLRAPLLAALVAACVWTAWQRFEHRAVHPADGQIAPGEPTQTDVTDVAPVRHGRWVLTTRAGYEVTARILAREDYSFDAIADLVPEDLALGWGPMSDNSVLAHFDISQGARFYTWRPRDALPVPHETVITHSANTHVIPADQHIRAELAALRVGQVVYLQGELVDAQRDDGAWLHTSMTRADSGAGACEVLLVESVAVR